MSSRAGLDEIAELIEKNDLKAKAVLLNLASRCWEKFPAKLRESKIFINKFGDKTKGATIRECLNYLVEKTPKKYKARYLKLSHSILPLNSALETISQIVKKSEFWKLDKRLCLSSLLARFEIKYAHVVKNVEKEFGKYMNGKSEYYFGTHSFVRVDTGELISADRKLQELAESLNLCLKFIQFSVKDTPKARLDTALETYRAGTFELAGEFWNSILYLINRVAFFNWYAIEKSSDPKVLYFQPTNKKEYLLEIIGGTRQNQWLFQLFQDTKYDYKKIQKYLKIDDPFYPKDEKEYRAYMELFELCKDTRIIDVAFRNGLKVKEYIRAWSTLKVMAEQQYSDRKERLLQEEKTVEPSHLLVRSEDEIISLLMNEGGLSESSAHKAIELFNFWLSNQDIFNSPLFLTETNEYLILSSVFLFTNPTRSALRLLAYEDIDLGFKGISFENYLEKTFKAMGFSCLKRYDYKDNEGDSDIDIIAYKENLFIICECKNLLPNESVYDIYRTKKLLNDKASKQALRGCQFVMGNLKDLYKKLSIEFYVKEKPIIVPVIITNIFDFTGLIFNGVPICDFSAIGKFATSKYVSRIIEGKDKREELPYIELYKGAKPTAKEVLEQIKNPFQIKFQIENIQETSVIQKIGEDITAEVYEIREARKK